MGALVRDDWRSELTLTFPVQRHHPAVVQPSGAVSFRSIAWLDAPRSIWGSHDGSDTYRHCGIGLSRSAEPPCRSHAIPGGVFDSAGWYVPIVDLDAREDEAKGGLGILLGGISIVRTFRYRFSFGEPERLSLDVYKERLIAINKQEKRMPKTWRKMEQAESFYQVMEADVPKPVMQAYFGPRTVKNWIDQPKRYS